MMTQVIEKLDNLQGGVDEMRKAAGRVEDRLGSLVGEAGTTNQRLGSLVSHVRDS
jgi:hypothetical protein